MAIQKITASVLGNNAVTAANVAAGALSAADIADNSLTAAKLSTSTFAIDSLTVNTSDLVVDTANNRVGIGENSPENILHIKKAASGSSYSPDSNDLVIIENNSSAGIDIRTPTGDSGGILFSDTTRARGAIIYYHSLDDMYFNVAGTSGAMVLDSSGNVGIGTVPQAFNTGYQALEVENFNFMSRQATDSYITTNSAYLGGWTTKITGEAAQYYQAGATHVWRTSASTSAGAATSWSERMRIHGSNCVGIGSTVDRSLGTNIGTLVVNGSAGGGLWLSTGDSSATTSKIYSITDGSVGELIINQGGSNGGTIKFTHNQSSTPTLALLSNGVHLFNTASQSGISNGTSNISCGSLGGGQLVLATNNDTLIILNRANGSGTMVTIRNNGSTVGSISQNGTSTSYNTSSDYRLKENISYEFNALDRVAQLRPARFNFIADADTTVDGFLAHEVQDIVPEAILGEKDAVDSEDNPEYQVIDQSKLVPLLTKAIQELSTKLEAAEARITELEG